MPGRGREKIAGLVLGLVAWVWLATLRVRVTVDPALEHVGDRRWVLAFWHGAQWPLLAWRRRRRTVVLVSHSHDGEIQARVLAIQGLRVVRGSSSRGGARGLAALVRAMKADDADAAFAVDGPRGPRGRAKGGAIVAARATGALLVPMAGVVRSGLVLARTWDNFSIAWPFTRVDVVLGRPIDPRSPGDVREELARALGTLHMQIGDK
ncbi:MAG: lysophospholipid acyltransferase family protein [Polyangiaceae bacterium]